MAGYRLLWFPFILLVVWPVIGVSATTTYKYSASSNASLLWGPYRPNLYFGIRPRIPKSLLMGLLWSNNDNPLDILKNLRHTCEQDEGMAGYGWTAYDVRKGGIQFINDTGNRLDLVTEFAKMSSDDRNGNWGLRIKGFPRADANDHPKTTLIFYLGTETPGSSLNCSNESELTSPSDDVVCGGTMAGLHGFKVILPERRADRQASHRTSVTSLRVPADTIWQAKSTLTDQLKNSDTVGMIANNPGQGNLHFVQKAFEGSFDLEVLFSSESSSETMTSSALTEATQDALSTFRERFHSVYLPQAPFEDEHHIKFSQSLISNLMGGIGYFDGTSKVDVSSAPEYAEMDQNFWEKASSAQSRASIEEQGPYQLFSMVPSRPFFPRGFLWDEGFHLQVIMEWDIDLALDIVSSWFNLMDDTGWIAREQILGPEARTKVPPEFQTQYTHYANPPTLFLVVESFLAKLDKEFPYFGAPSQHLETPERGRDFLRAIYPKLKKHYEWFRRTQAGNLKVYQLVDSAFSQGYRWRGRTPQHTLTSGLDDYPRALPPHPEELHVDALCWVGSMAVTLKKISDLLSEQEDQEEFSKDKNDIIRSIDGIHWSESHQAYCDATVVEENRVEKVCHKGYISLFPFLVNLMGPDNPRLGAVLDLVRDPEQLWSPHGVRSLSAQDEYYGTDENYWRSPIWININYMVIQRLLELAQGTGPYHQKARGIYAELRLNLVNTVYESWKETGFAWEQYNSDTGKGQRTQHFTGWTSLIVRIMAMPDLQPPSRPQSPAYTSHKTNKDGWDTRLVLTAIGLFLICYLFRKRLKKAWPGIATV